MKLVIVNVITVCGIMFTVAPWSASEDMTFEEAMNAGNASGNAVNQQIDVSSIDPDEAVPGYVTDSPKETAYYDNQSQISTDAGVAASENEAAQLVTEGYVNRPNVVIDAENDPLIKNTRSLEEQADTIVGVNEQLGDCTIKTVDYVGSDTQEVCTVYADKVDRSCEPTLEVVCDRVQYTATEKHTGWYTLATHNGEGKEQWCDIDFWEPNGGQIYVHAYFNRRCIDCWPESNPFVYTHFGDESCTETWEELAKRQLSGVYSSIGEIQSIEFSDGVWGDQSELTITTTKEIDYCDWRETWNDSTCTPLSGSHCLFQNEQCVEGPETRVIEHPHSIYQACWKKRRDYLCLSGTGSDETYCDELLARGCTQSDARCLGGNNGYCTEAEKVFDCPSQKTVYSEEIIDCSTQTYCLDGNCFDSSYPPNNDLALAATHLAIIDSFADEFDPDNFKIFGGTPLQCGKAVLGFANCCKDGGWGTDLSLDDCNADEKELGQKRENQACHFIGDYCSNEDPFGTCTSRKYVYCCYGSELSRLIQEGGHDQLGIPWGDVDDPQCQGFTPERLQEIDFSQIDFSNVYPDMLDNVTPIDQGTLQQDLQQKMEQRFGTQPSP